MKRDQATSEFEEKVVQISRVSKKTKGGNKIGFAALVVVGDKKGQVGVALGKAPDVLSAIRKGVKKAKKKLIQVPLDGTTIPFAIRIKKGAGEVLLKPAPRGSGVIAGGPVRSVVEVAGIRDISSKIMGSQNQASSVYATFAALSEIERLVRIKQIKLKSVAQVEAAEEAKIKAAAKKEPKLAKPAESAKTASKADSKVTKPEKSTKKAVKQTKLVSKKGK